MDLTTVKLNKILTNTNYFYNNIMEQNLTTTTTNNNNNNTNIMDSIFTPTSPTYKNLLNNSIINYTNNIFYNNNINNNNDNDSIYLDYSYLHCNEYEKLELELVTKITPILTPIFFGIIAITGFFGNSLVILVVILNSYMHSTTNLLIVNLACADLLFVIFCIPFTAFDYMVYKWPFGLAWCKIVQYLIVVTALASIYTLVLMSIDRFLAIVYPVRSRSIRTEFLTKIAIIILWISVLVISVPVLRIHTLSNFTCNNATWIFCTYSNEAFIEPKYFYLIFFTTAYFLPLILICALYIKIVSRLWRRIGGTKMSAESQKGRRRVTRVVVVVVLAFALLWFPIQILLLLKSFKYFDESNAISIITILGAQTIAYTSSCINPILYAFLSENFRKAFQKAIYFSSSYRFGSSKQYNDLSTTSTAAVAARRRISAVQDSVAVI